MREARVMDSTRGGGVKDDTILFCISGPHFYRMFLTLGVGGGGWGCRVLDNFPDSFDKLHALTLS